MSRRKNITRLSKKTGEVLAQEKVFFDASEEAAADTKEQQEGVRQEKENSHRRALKRLRNWYENRDGAGRATWVGRVRDLSLLLQEQDKEAALEAIKDFPEPLKSNLASDLA